MTLTSADRRQLEDRLAKAERAQDLAGAVAASASGFSGQVKRAEAEAASVYWEQLAARLRAELDEPAETSR